MFKYKMNAMYGEINEEGHLRLIPTTCEEQQLYDVFTREEAIDSCDAWRLTFIEEKLTEPGRAMIVRLYEENTEDEKYEKEINFQIIVRGYRPSGFDLKGEQTYTKDDDDTPQTPVYDTYERFVR